MIGQQRVAKAPAGKATSQPPAADPKKLTKQAIAFWGEPTLSKASQEALASYAKVAAVDAATQTWEREQYPTLALNALRALVVATPDYQTC
ncbi:MAG: hypothetical protein WAU42_04765 [Solirubrobacteraceae bacterium]